MGVGVGVDVKENKLQDLCFSSWYQPRRVIRRQKGWVGMKYPHMPEGCGCHPHAPVSLCVRQLAVNSGGGSVSAKNLTVIGLILSAILIQLALSWGSQNKAFCLQPWAAWMYLPLGLLQPQNCLLLFLCRQSTTISAAGFYREGEGLDLSSPTERSYQADFLKPEIRAITWCSS